MKHRRSPWLLLLLAGALVQAGCSTGGGLGRGPELLVRPNAPPEYDVLVAQDLARQGRRDEAIAAYQRAVAKDPDSAYLQRSLAEQLLQAKRFDAALSHARLAGELDPEDVPTRILLGTLHRQRRDVESAEAILTDDAGDPIDSGAAAQLYHLYLENLKPKKALGAALWWVENEPASVRARMALAHAHSRLKQPLQAESALRDALEYSPGNLSLYGALARSLRQRGDVAGEIGLYREILQHDPGNHAALAALADAQWAAGDRDGAILTLEELEERYPSDLRASARLGYWLYQLRRFVEAQRYFERVLAADPEQHQMEFLLGLARRGAGDISGALDAFQRVPADDEYYADARTQLATIHERRGDYARALAELERALAVKPTRSLELYALTLRARNGDFERAVRQLEAMVQEKPQDDELIYNLGVIYGEAERVDEAIEYMRLALSHNPENASALNYIGYTWAERGIQLDEAERMIVRALELRPDDGYIADSLGWVYYMRARPLVEMGRGHEAQPYIERALRELYRADELTGGDPVVSEHLGDTYLLLDDKVRALEKFEEAVRLEPRVGEQPHLYEKLESLQRELE